MFACNSFYRYMNNPYFGPMHHCHCNDIFSQMFQFTFMQRMMNSFFQPQYPIQMPQMYTMPMVRPYSVNPAFSSFGSQLYPMNYNNNSIFSSRLSNNNNLFTLSNYFRSNIEAGENDENKKTTGAKKVLQKTEYVKIACEKAKKYGVDERLVLAVIDVESRFINNRTSSAGAKGLMQLMPDTARGLGVKDVMDPEQNIDGGVRLLRDLLKQYNGNVKYALAAYNWGPGNVNAYLKGEKSMPKETRDYIKIADRYQNYQVA